MTDLTGKRIRINENYPGAGTAIGLEGIVLGLSRDSYQYEVRVYSGFTFLLLKEWFDIIDEEDNMEKSPHDSLTELQKLCTTNNIHILVAQNDYQIWDEHSDDTYEMDNVDDVMKAIECLNELKEWRQ